MKSTVYFTNMRATSKKNSLVNKLGRLLEKTGFLSELGAGDLTAIKLHFGEKGNTTFLHPVFVRKIVDLVKERKAKPFLTDSNTLYFGSRSNSVDHIQTALENGFSYATVGAPIIIADGLIGKNTEEVEINLKHFDKVKIAGDIYHAKAMIVLSHVKGHGLAGMGGAIKNLAMGCASASGKQRQHSTVKPKVQAECIGCSLCSQWCPEGAITVENQANINPEICIGCGECITVCPTKSIKPEWDTEMDAFQERMVEHAYGAVKNKQGKVVYINFVMNVTPDCDCTPWSDQPIVPDVGILASLDPVAIDKASYDLVNQQLGHANTHLTCNHEKGANKWKGMENRHEIPVEIQFAYGQQIGLGHADYELVEI